jgi:hypothetical protein
MGAGGLFCFASLSPAGRGFVNSFARQISQKRHAHVAFHAERLTVRPHTRVLVGESVRGIIEMREYSDFVACPCCGETMRLARTLSHASLPPMETFECKPCGLAVASEAVTGSHALIEKRYLY